MSRAATLESGEEEESEDSGRAGRTGRQSKNWQIVEELGKNRKNWKTVEESEDSGRIGRTGRLGKNQDLRVLNRRRSTRSRSQLRGVSGCPKPGSSSSSTISH